jgi:hypothetical protein
MFLPFHNLALNLNHDLNWSKSKIKNYVQVNSVMPDLRSLSRIAMRGHPECYRPEITLDSARGCALRLETRHYVPGSSPE